MKTTWFVLSAIPIAIAFIGASAFSWKCGGAQSEEQSLRLSSQSIEETVDSLVHLEALNRGVPGLSVALVIDGKVILQQGYGFADIESKREVTEDTPFNIASITKPFTAALVVQLASEGRLNLDAFASEYLDLPPVYRHIRIRQLLNHTSGIARDLRLDNNDDPDSSEYRRRLNVSQPSSPPGTRFEYSNTGYTVLGWLVEAIEHQPLEQVLRSRIFTPLGMLEARYRASLSNDTLRARPHAVVEGQAEPTVILTGGFGSGGISLSASDFASFGIGLQTGTFLSHADLKASWTPGLLANGQLPDVRINTNSDAYGFGWFLTEFAGHRLVTHGGGITGFSSNLYHFPDDSVTIAILANVKGRDDGAAPVDILARRIADICLAASDRE